jgi:uncharacterized protein
VHFVERALRFPCHDASLYGVLSIPAQPAPRGVLIVVGGPQYRAGSHRQFVLLARQLAEAGIAALRFDYRGMGDSEGDVRNFEEVDDDIRAAVDRFAAEVPAVSEFVIFGLCDATCAALFYAHRDARVCGLVLANPWIRTTEGLARAHLKHYYLARLLDRELWQKLFAGRFEYRKAGTAFFRTLSTVVSSRLSRKVKAKTSASDASDDRGKPLPDRMLDACRHFRGRVLLILSGNDLTAKEFMDMVDGAAEWREQLASPAVDCRHLQHANHTFSRRDWRDQLSQWIKEWISSF